MIERRRGRRGDFQQKNWKDGKEKSVSRGRGRRAAIEVQVVSKWARELEESWRRERGRES